MSDEMKRAIEMLKVAAKYLRNHAGNVSSLIYYDGADCDGLCVADDCIVAAEMLEQDISLRVEEGIL